MLMRHNGSYWIFLKREFLLRFKGIRRIFIAAIRPCRRFIACPITVKLAPVRVAEESNHKLRESCEK
jgi:hypothetical protein